MEYRSKKEKFIRERQAYFPNIEQMQEWIDKGFAWSMEGTVGREAMRGLELGMYFLPNKSHRDYYGNPIPSRKDISKGAKGSLENAYDFYQNDNNIWELELNENYDKR